MDEVIAKTRLHETWQTSSAEERYLFIQDICHRYGVLISRLIGGENDRNTTTTR